MKHARLTIFIICLLFPFVGMAQDSSNVKNENNIDRLLDLVPVKQTLTELPNDLKSQFSQNPFGISASNNEQLIKLFGEAYHADSLFNIAQRHFKQNFNPKYTNSVLTTLTSDEIKPVLKSEANFYSIQGIRKQIVTKYELEQDQPSQERVSIIKDLIEKRSAKDSEVESQSILFGSLVLGTDAISSRLNLSEAQINGITNNFNNRLKMQLDDELVNNYLVMYYGLDYDHLSQYADFYATEAGTEFKKTLTESIHTAFQEASNQLISTIKSL